MVKTITVEAGKKLREGEVAIWEKDDAHPDGEVYITNRPGKTCRVGLTSAVQRALGEGRLEQVDDNTDEPAKVRVKRQSTHRTTDATPREAGEEPTTDGGAQAPE